MTSKFLLALVLALYIKGSPAAQLEYVTTILSDPPNGPFRLGSPISFTCLVDPTPPDPITYQWRVLSSYNAREYSGQNITVTPSYLDLHFSRFFCHVFSNSTSVSVGNRLVELQGLFNNPSELVRHFTAGGTLTVSLNFTADIIRLNVRDLTWYHNGSGITSSGRFAITNGDRVLNITDLHSSDAGLYQVKSSQISLNDFRGDSCLLPLLENHSGFAPITFIVRESSQSQIKPYDSSRLVFPVTNTSYFPDGDGETHSLKIELHFDVDLNLLDLGDNNLNWFHNGIQLNTNDVKYDSSIIVSGQAVQMMLSINNITDKDAGTYSVALYEPVINVGDFLATVCGARAFSFRLGRLRINAIILGTATMTVEKYEPPVVELSLAQSLPEGSFLVCSAKGGSPESYQHNILLTRNETTLSHTLGDRISYNLSVAFGVYTCIVESLFTNTSKTILFPQRVNFQILVESTDSQCEQEHIKDVNSILMSIMAVIEAQCNCKLSMHNFEGSRLTCLGYGPNALFTSTLVYSDSEGKVLASNLVEILQSQLEAMNGQVLDIEGTSFVFSTGCQSSTSGGILAGLFVGGWIVGLLTFALAIGIGACILKIRTSVPKQRGKDNSERQAGYAVSQDKIMTSIKVKPNTAYETVIRQQDQETLEQLYEIPEP